MKPLPLSAEALASVLRDMASRVEAGDSYEGSIEYLMPTDEEFEAVDDVFAMVRASYRVGNTDGQGGLRMIGDMRVATASADFADAPVDTPASGCGGGSGGPT